MSQRRERLQTRRGTFKLNIDRVPGSPAWPMTAADREEKFLDCAGRVLGSAGAKTLYAMADCCGEMATIAELTRATVPIESRLAAAQNTAAIV